MIIFFLGWGGVGKHKAFCCHIPSNHRDPYNGIWVIEGLDG